MAGKNSTKVLFWVSLWFVFGVIAAGESVRAGQPSYYVKKATWQETMRASREALLEFDAAEETRQAGRLKGFGIEPGPWYSIGPFSSPNTDPYKAVFGPEVELDLAATYADGKLKWSKRPDWQDGVVHRLSGDAASGAGKTVADYMFRQIKAGEAVTLPVYLGSNDGIQVWFNGERVLANDIGRKAAPDQEMMNLGFKKGVNRFLIKVNNRAAAHAFYFSMHPGGGVKARRYEGLWELLAGDFPTDSERQQMRWEREDKIWKDYQPGKSELLARSYAAATRDIGKLAEQAAQLAVDAGAAAEVEKVRQRYYRSRLYDEIISNAQRRLNLVAHQFSYLQGMYEGRYWWKSYTLRVKALQQTAEYTLAEARKGNPASLAELKRIEGDMLELYKSRLPRTPAPPKRPACAPFELKHVRLLAGPFKEAMERDRKYLYDLDSGRLLHMFRVTAGMPSAAEPLGGWEKRELRGHTMGHYLSACALMYASTGDEKLKAKADAIVSELGKCQKSIGTGYLGAFSAEGIKKVIYGTGNWWAPWYTYHKILAGMLDMYIHCGNKEALAIAEGMADWTKKHLDNIDEQQSQRMLKVEFGGMNEVLCNLYAITRNRDHLALAKRFDHDTVFEPLAHFRDELTGLHVNTQIPKIIGAARAYELTGEQYYYNIATFFWHQVVEARSYCTGGTSNNEHWQTEPYVLARELGPATQETCCTYNMLKLTRHLFCWNPKPGYGDYYERALFNSILSTQDPKTGMMMYFVPLGSGYWKIFNTPCDSFWCCTGTGLENHAKYGDSIYFHDANGVYVNLFIASAISWPSFMLTQETNFPEEPRTTFIIHTKTGRQRLVLRIRIPYWATKPVSITINGEKQDLVIRPSSFVTLDREWKNGDKVEVEMPMSLHLHRMPDDGNLAAIMYGPLVLAGQLGDEGLDPKTVYSESQGVLRNVTVEPGPSFVADVDNLEAWIKPVAGKSLTFRTVGAGRPKDVTLAPYHKLFGQRYGIYWHIEPESAKK